MIFNTLNEAVDWFRKYKPFDDNTIPDFWLEHDTKNWKLGDWILIQYVKDYDKISRPIFGVFADFTVWDQALVVQLLEQARAWEFSNQVVTNKEYNIKMPICALDKQVEAFELWTSNIYVVGHWKNKPTFSELKSAMKNAK